MITITRSGVLLFTVMFALSVAGCGNTGNTSVYNTGVSTATPASSPQTTQGTPRAKLNLNTATANDMLSTPSKCSPICSGAMCNRVSVG